MLQVETKYMGRALTILQRIPLKDMTNPLAYLWLYPQRDGVSITALNYEVKETLKVKADNQMEQVIGLPARRFIEAVLRSPEEKTQMELIEDGERLRIKSGNFKMTLPVIDPEEAPEENSFKPYAKVIVPDHVLLQIVEKCSFAMSKDEGRPHINGIHMKFYKEDGYAWVEAVATDGPRMSLVRYRINGLEVEGHKDESMSLHMVEIDGRYGIASMLLHRIGVVELKRFLDGRGEEIEVRIGKKAVEFVKKNGRLMARLIEIEFPKYELVIPQDHEYAFVAEAGQLREAIKRVAVSSDEVTHGVRMNLRQGVLHLRAEDVNGMTASDMIGVDNIEGKDFELDVNYVYFLDALSVFNRRVEVRVNDQFKPVVVVDPDEPDRVLQLLMPISDPSVEG